MQVKLKKLSVVGLLAEKQKILDTLRRTENFELASVKDIVGETKLTAEDAKLRDDYLQKLASINACIELIKRSGGSYDALLKRHGKLVKKGKVEARNYQPEKQSKPLFETREEIMREEFANTAKNKDKLLESVAKYEKMQARLLELDAEEKRAVELSKEVLYFIELTSHFIDIKHTKNTFMFLGKMDKGNVDKLHDEIEVSDSVSLDVLGAVKKRTGIIIVGPVEHKEKYEELLQSNGFEPTTIKVDKNAVEYSAQLQKQLTDIYFERLELNKTISQSLELSRDLKILYDFYNLEIEAIEAKTNIGETQSTYALVGWIPESKSEEICKKVRQASNCVFVEATDPEKGDTPPTYLRNSKIVAPFESVTNMYSSPAPHERDPNIFVAIFSFIFLGMMIGDAGYGILLFGGLLALILTCKMEKGMKDLVMIICVAGLSSIIWGAITNSWFGFELGFYNAPINAMTSAIEFLVLALMIGLIQVFVGFIIKTVDATKQDGIITGFCEGGFKALLLIGAIPYIPTFITVLIPDFSFAIPAPIQYIGLTLIGISILGLIYAGARTKKNIFAGAMSGIGKLYDLVGLISDILSYCRLFGLALSGAVIGMVANTLGALMLDVPIPGLNYLLAFIVAAAFHAFNIGMSALGAYVNSARLQFVEFFGKFYTGDGRLFSPLGTRTKYITFK